MAHGGAAGRGGAEQNGTPTGPFDQETTGSLAFQGIEDNCLNFSSGARTNERIRKSMEEQNPRLTHGLFAVGNRFIYGTTAALRSLSLTSVPSLISSRIFVSCKARPRITILDTCRIQKSNMQRAELGGAAHGDMQDASENICPTTPMTIFEIVFCFDYK